MNRRSLLVVLLTAVALALGASPAAAGTVRFDLGQAELAYNAPDGETNDVNVTTHIDPDDACSTCGLWRADGPYLTVHDADAPALLDQSAQLVCFRPATHTVTCWRDAVKTFFTYLRDGSDRLDLRVQALPSTVWGGTGNDILHGGYGNDRILGMGGDDQIRGDAAADGLGDAAQASASDRLIGGAGEDDVRGGLGNDRLEGEQQQDLLMGETGSDTLDGGSGPDGLNGGPGTDRISYAVRTKRVKATLGHGSGNGQKGENDTFAGNEEHLEGGSVGDALRGDGGANSMYGGGGSDLMWGEGGPDHLYGETDGGGGTAGDDLMWGGPGKDYLDGWAGDDVVTGGSGADVLWASGGGDDTVSYADHTSPVKVTASDQKANDGSNGGAEKDKVGLGFDMVLGGAGDDVMLSGSQSSGLFGGKGDDYLLGGDGADDLYGSTGDDRLYGGDAGDDLVGGSGADHLYGGPYHDELDADDGQQDAVISCSEGTDAAHVDDADPAPSGCESVD